MYFFSLLSHFSLPSAPPLLFIFLFLFFLFSWKRNCYAQSAIRLFRRCYPEHRNADVPVFSTLWIKFPLHSIFFFFFLHSWTFLFFLEFRFVFSIETQFFSSFFSVAFYVPVSVPKISNDFPPISSFVALINSEFDCILETLRTTNKRGIFIKINVAIRNITTSIWMMYALKIFTSCWKFFFFFWNFVLIKRTFFYGTKLLPGNVRMYIKFQNEILVFHKKFFLHLDFWFNSFLKIDNMILYQVSNIDEVKYLILNKLINSRIKFLNMLD